MGIFQIEAKLDVKNNFLPLDKCWYITRLNLPLNRSLHCDWYEYLQYFVFIVVSGIIEFIHKDFKYFENNVTKQGLPP